MYTYYINKCLKFLEYMQLKSGRTFEVTVKKCMVHKQNSLISGRYAAKQGSKVINLKLS